MPVRGLPDWQDTAAYAPVLAGGPLALAWELLRRDPAYRAGYAALGQASTAATAASFAAHWGLHFPG
jgi:hypothetical protein